jgi:hypothetical protein
MKNKQYARKIDELIWKALTNANFRDGLLNGRRHEILDAWDLTERERETMMAVRASTLEDFAGALNRACAESIGIQF